MIKILFIYILFSILLSVAIAFLPSRSFLLHNTRSTLSASTIATETDVVTEDSIINITERARKHLETLRKDSGDLYLRMGVRSGGCSGMSYVMDVIDSTTVTEEDQIVEYDGIKCVVDPKSLLYLYGLQLDYSDELIGGGFKFQNPNAETSCGCGKSFGV